MYLDLHHANYTYNLIMENELIEQHLIFLKQIKIVELSDQNKFLEFVFNSEPKHFQLVYS
jgi:hypothetical protein